MAIVKPYVLLCSIILRNGSLGSVSLLFGQAMWLDILRNIAEVLDIRFDTPVPLILEQQWMLVKESGLRLAMSRDRVTQHLPRIEPTHGMIALQTTIHDGRVALLCNTFLDRKSVV